MRWHSREHLGGEFKVPFGEESGEGLGVVSWRRFVVAAARGWGSWLPGTGRVRQDGQGFAEFSAFVADFGVDEEFS
jgi:hypothetical protein